MKQINVTSMLYSGQSEILEVKRSRNYAAREVHNILVTTIETGKVHLQI